MDSAPGRPVTSLDSAVVLGVSSVVLGVAWTVSKLMSVEKSPSRSWVWLFLCTFATDWDFFRAIGSNCSSAEGVGLFCKYN